jgi:hypothetical protein
VRAAGLTGRLQTQRQCRRGETGNTEGASARDAIPFSAIGPPLRRSGRDERVEHAARPAHDVLQDGIFSATSDDLFLFAQGPRGVARLQASRSCSVVRRRGACLEHSFPDWKQR